MPIEFLFEKIGHVGDNGLSGCCDMARRDNVFIFKERPDNSGPSVTNSALALHTTAAMIIGGKPDAVVMFEHCGADYHGKDSETFHLVEVDMKTFRPSWHTVSRAYVEGVWKSGERV